VCPAEKRLVIGAGHYRKLRLSRCEPAHENRDRAWALGTTRYPARNLRRARRRSGIDRLLPRARARLRLLLPTASRSHGSWRRKPHFRRKASATTSKPAAKKLAGGRQPRGRHRARRSLDRSASRETRRRTMASPNPFKSQAFSSERKAAWPRALVASSVLHTRWLVGLPPEVAQASATRCTRASVTLWSWILAPLRQARA
jgi:hypothetical protein